MKMTCAPLDIASKDFRQGHIHTRHGRRERTGVMRRSTLRATMGILSRGRSCSPDESELAIWSWRTAVHPHRTSRRLDGIDDAMTDAVRCPRSRGFRTAGENATPPLSRDVGEKLHASGPEMRSNLRVTYTPSAAHGTRCRQREYPPSSAAPSRSRARGLSFPASGSSR